MSYMTNNEEANTITEKQFQEKMLLYRTLENRVNSMVKQREMFASKIAEIQSTLSSIDEMENGQREMMFPLGSAAFVLGKIMDKSKLIIEVGAGVALEESSNESKKILEKTKKELEGAIEIFQKDIQSAVITIKQMEAEIQQMLSKTQQKEQKFRVVSNQ